MKNTTIFLITLLVFSGCENEKELKQQISPTHKTHIESMELYGRPASNLKSKNFIAGYLIPKELTIKVSPIFNPKDAPNTVSGPIGSFSPETLINGWFHQLLDSTIITVNLNEFPDKLEYSNNVVPENSLLPINQSVGSKFNALAEKFNDISYNGGYWVTNIIFSPLNSLTVVCDTNFDTQHPAGVPLDDIINATYYSAEKFINSNYSDMESGNIQNKSTENLALLNKKHINLYNGFFLQFIKRPKDDGIYQFTVEYKDANGLILSKELPKIRLKGEL